MIIALFLTRFRPVTSLLRTARTYQANQFLFARMIKPLFRIKSARDLYLRQSFTVLPHVHQAAASAVLFSGVGSIRTAFLNSAKAAGNWFKSNSPVPRKVGGGAEFGSRFTAGLSS